MKAQDARVERLERERGPIAYVLTSDPQREQREAEARAAGQRIVVIESDTGPTPFDR